MQHSLVVLLDLNVLGWLYKPSPTTPKSFDLQQERAALRSLQSWSSPPIIFKYDEDHFDRFYAEHAATVASDFPKFKKTFTRTLDQFAKDCNDFEQRLKEHGEEQDDIRVLSTLLFRLHDPVKYIVTLDERFTKRLPSLHRKIQNDTQLLQWVHSRRPDFFQVEVLLPSQLLAKLTQQASI